jgi:hypothetical protein
LEHDVMSIHNGKQYTFYDPLQSFVDHSKTSRQELVLSRR